MVHYSDNLLDPVDHRFGFVSGMTMFNNGVSRVPSRLKGDMIRKLVENADLTVVAAYGSVKDVSIYQSIYVPAERTFVVGKYKTRFRDRARFIEEGYALHLGEFSIISHQRDRSQILFS